MQTDIDLTAAQSESEQKQRDPATEARQLLGLIVTGVSLGLGFIGNALFYDKGFGINLPIYLALFIIVAFLLIHYRARPIYPRHAIFFFPALLFALLLTFTSAPDLLFLNFSMMLGCLFLALRYTTRARGFMGDIRRFIMENVSVVFHAALQSPMLNFFDGLDWLVLHRPKMREESNLIAVLRGIVLTVPLVVIFGVLLSSADAVFGQLMGDLLDLFSFRNMDSFLGQMLVVVGLAWWSSAGLMLLFSASAQASSAPNRKRGFRLSLIESGMMLGVVDLMLLVFMVLQARYLFGGEANITEQGFTYAQYARRGFYELIAVSLLTVGLIVSLDTVTRRKREREYVFQAFATLMILLTLFLLIAALYRLNLYENAYGFTRLRVMSGVFALWLGVLLAVLLSDVVMRWKRHFWTGCILTLMGFVVSLNVLNVDAFIARENIRRFEQSDAIDVYYLMMLSDDAVPVLVDLLGESNLTDAQHSYLASDLGCRLLRLDRERASGNVLDYHFGRDAAWHALNAHRDYLITTGRCGSRLQ